MKGGQIEFRCQQMIFDVYIATQYYYEAYYRT